MSLEISTDILQINLKLHISVLPPTLAGKSKMSSIKNIYICVAENFNQYVMRRPVDFSFDI